MGGLSQFMDPQIMLSLSSWFEGGFILAAGITCLRAVLRYFDMEVDEDDTVL